ncbi:MAG: hypothetical protein ABI353_07360 [Isosphaeraceae bacterium]
MTRERTVPPLDPDTLERTRRALGLRPLSLGWAKGEILLGLSAAVLGVKLLPGTSLQSLAGGVLIVLGLYLAMAGHRSHLYLSLNRWNAYLVQLLSDHEPPEAAT